MKCRAAAPTGIAAANIEVEGTDIAATTVHNLFDFDGDYTTKLDFTKLDQKKVINILEMRILLLDEVSLLTLPDHRSITSADLKGSGPDANVPRCR